MKISDKKRRLKDGLGRKSRLAITPLMRIGHLQFCRDHLFPRRVLNVDVMRQQLLASKHYLTDMDVPLYKLPPIV